MKKIPYGISSYETIQTDNYYFVDKTKYIELIENLGGRYLFFLRPRRFGKSLFVSMLEHYYDINAKDKFDVLFGDTYIGKNPTPLKNSYPILRFNFSMVPIKGNIEKINHSFLINIIGEICIFINKYAQRYNLNLDIINRLEQETDAGDVFLLFHREMRIKNVSFYLIIDEYDNFGNNILIEHGPTLYKTITHAGGFLRSFFAIIKGLTDNREIDRLFITGVSPLVMADVTSGFNIGDNISLDSIVSSMVGLTLLEVKQILEYYQSFNIFKEPIEQIIIDFDQWYNGYSFCEEINKVYNTISVLFYINQYIKKTKSPSNLIDKNLRTDYGKMRFLILEGKKLNGNFNILKGIVENGETKGELVDSFALEELVDEEKFRSLLYYLGFITIKSVMPNDIMVFAIPNKLIRVLLWEYLQKAYIDGFGLKINVDFIKNSFENLALNGEWKPVFQYIIDKFYEAVSARDFVFHEEGLKTFLLAYLNLTNLYEVISEKEKNKGYADITLEPDRRYVAYIKYDYLIELKFVKAEDISTKEKEEAAIKNKYNEAIVQLQQYSANEKFNSVKIIIIAAARKLLYLDNL